MRSNTQLAKEVRQLAWPWLMVAVPGLLVLLRPWMGNLPEIPMASGALRGLTEWVLPMGTFFGTALLAALPLGAEFQYRTLAMRLAQPIDRERLWRQKFLLTLVAVVPVAVIYCTAVGMREGRPFAIMAAAWILVTLAGAIPFTLLARTTIGGMVMNCAGAFLVSLCWMYYEKHESFPTWALWSAGIGIVAYSCLMTWLGRRMLLRFQAVDGMQATQDFVPGARFVPQAVVEWFRPRARQPIANLVRREFRLVRIVWPMALLYNVGWALMIAFHQLPTDLPPTDEGQRRIMFFAFTAILGLIITVLAGTLSLGEEKTWGTHDWHMTAPISISTQWAVKLLFAEFTSLICVAVAPMLMLVLSGRAGDAANAFLKSDIALGWALEVAGITLAAFWCACAVKGTVQATLWVFPLCFGIGFSGLAGAWILEALQHPVTHNIARAVAWLDPVEVGRAASRLVFTIGYQNLTTAVAAPLVAIALIQTLRMFRAQTGANKLRVVRGALPMMMVAFGWGAMTMLLFGVLYESWQQQRAIVQETDKAIAALQAAEPGMATRPRQAALSDLTKAAAISEGTKRWLRDANITIAGAPELQVIGGGQYFPGRMAFVVRSDELKNRAPYSAVVRNARGRDCSIMFQIQHAREEKYNVGYVTVICE